MVRFWKAIESNLLSSSLLESVAEEVSRRLGDKKN
jgi:hypothetical protein